MQKLLNFYRSAKYLTISEDTADLIWQPKITFCNVLSVEKNDGVGYKNVPEYYFEPNRQIGKLQIAETMKIKFPCDFQFHTFPFDKHECNLSFYERLHDSKTVILNPSIQITHGNQKCCQYKSSSLILTTQKSPFKIEIQINPSSFIYNGQVSVASIKLKLQRETIELLMGSFFVPTGMFSILSMMSYVINPDAVSSKVSVNF